MNFNNTYGYGSGIAFSIRSLQIIELSCHFCSLRLIASRDSKYIRRIFGNDEGRNKKKSTLISEGFSEETAFRKIESSVELCCMDWGLREKRRYIKGMTENKAVIELNRICFVSVFPDTVLVFRDHLFSDCLLTLLVVSKSFLI